MDKGTAERWVTISALTVILIYGYRRLTESTSTPVTVKKLAGVGQPAPLAAFATAWGFTFMMISIIAEAAPGVGGGFAIVIAVTNLLANISGISQDVTKLEGKDTGSATTQTSKPQPIGSGPLNIPTKGP